MPFWYPIGNASLQGKTLIIPVVSAANVSQLAVDLLIASLSLRLAGVFNPEYFVPVVGGREDGLPGITTPYELYGKDGVDIVVIQQRSPVLKNCKEAYINGLLEFLSSSGLKSVIFLSGMDQINRIDSQMLVPTYYIHPPTSPPLTSTPLESVTHMPIPVYTSPVGQYPQQGAEEEGKIPFIPGGGLTRRILSSLPPQWAVPTVALLHFVFEGDNRGDANLLAAVVAKVTGVDNLIHQWNQPESWQLGLFGPPHTQTLYG